jgi:hypothetical protein
MQVAIALMCPGVPVTACAIMLPRVSKTPAERSPDSRTIVVNDVRMSAVACSLTTAISRFQITSSVIGSIIGHSISPVADRASIIKHLTHLGQHRGEDG